MPGSRGGNPERVAPGPRHTAGVTALFGLKFYDVIARLDESDGLNREPSAPETFNEIDDAVERGAVLSDEAVAEFVGQHDLRARPGALEVL